jgi:hypothetical protein
MLSPSWKEKTESQPRCPWAIALALICLALPCPAQISSPAEDPFLGVFSDDSLTLTLQTDGHNYQGAIEFQGNTFAVSAGRDGDRLSGSFDANGTDFPFEAVRQGETLRFETAGTVYHLAPRAVRSKPANPLAGGGGAQPASQAGNEAGPRYQSSDGYSLALPAGWQAEEDNTGDVRLIPPAAASDQEIYAVSAAEGVSDTSDLRVAAFLQSTFIHADSQPTATHQSSTQNAGSTPIVVHDWRFAHPETGQPLRLSARLVASQGQVFVVLGTGQPDRVGSRQADLQRIAGSLRYTGQATVAGAGAPTRSPQAAASPQQGIQSAQGVQTDPQAPPTPGRLSDAKPDSEQWLKHLRGKLLTRMESYTSGTSGGYSRTERMLLYPDGRFEHYRASSVSVYVDLGSGGSAGEGTRRGTWRIVSANDSTFLALVYEGAAEEEYARLTFNDNKTFVDGERTFVTDPE